MHRVGYLAGMFLLAVIALVLALNLHEMGHTLVARLAGDSDAKYFLYRHDPNLGSCIGCNLYDDKRLSYAGNIAVTVAGVMTTQTLALSLLVWGSRKRLHSAKRRVILLTAFVFMLDMPLQALQALEANVARQQRLTRVDLADTLYLIKDRVPLSSTTLKVALACCVVSYGTVVAWLYDRGRRSANESA